MARRSRRSDAVDAKPESKGRVCRMGVYARTSKSYDDDGCSIANQQRIVADHVDRLPDAVVAAYYVDDGFTGTNQDRDAFQRMIEDLRAGRIDGIAAKDASRLGRDYVECQSFIRDMLPSLGARLILVSDRVDSKDNATLDDFAIDMRSLLNDLYSRDLSRKIHATFESSRRRGPLILGNIPYGYLRDPNDTHHLIPDPATAPIVREMFRMKIAGEANAAIARWLEEAGAPTAGEVKYARAGMEATSRDSRRWHARNVSRMLENPVYAGRVVMNKWTQKRYLGIPHEKNDEREWLVVENAHEPLVQPERFDELKRAHGEKVAKKREKRAATDRIRQKHPDRLPGKMRCGICGARMSICRWIEDGVFWGAEYMCNRKDAGEGGGRHRIAVPLVETICMDVIRSQIEQRVSIERLVDSKMADGTLSRRLAEATKGIAAIEREMEDIEDRALKLKGEHMGSGISSRDYKRIERTLWSQLEEAKKRRNDLVARRDLLDSIAENGAGLFAEGEGASLMDSFSAELADMAIESVTFEGDDRVSVRLRFTDAYSRMRQIEEALS